MAARTISSNRVSEAALVNRLLLLIMAALLLLFRLVRVFFAWSKMALQGCHFVHRDLTHKIDDRKFPGLSHQNHHAANFVTILEDVDFVILVAALLDALDDFAPAGRGQLGADRIDITFAVLDGFVKLKTFDVDALEIFDN